MMIGKKNRNKFVYIFESGYTLLQFSNEAF